MHEPALLSLSNKRCVGRALHLETQRIPVPLGGLLQASGRTVLWCVVQASACAAKIGLLAEKIADQQQVLLYDLAPGATGLPRLPAFAAFEGVAPRSTYGEGEAAAGGWPAAMGQHSGR